MKIAKIGVLVIGVLSQYLFAQTEAEHYVPEADSILYQRAKDCHDVDLSTWKHPTRDVIDSEDLVSIYRLELCNGDKYPIFYIGSDTAMMASRNYGLRQWLLEQLLLKNAKWPYAVVLDDFFVLFVEKFKEGNSGEVVYTFGTF